MDKIIDKKYFRTDEFEIVNEWPTGYFIWNIGRENFMHPEYIPLARHGSLPHHVDLNTLKAFKCENEEIALKCMKAAMHTNGGYFYYEDYQRIINN